MSLVRGRGNKSRQLLAATMFRRCGISGRRRHVLLVGRPDFVSRVARVAVFVDGCFWHVFPIHGRIPEANMEFWTAKLTANRARDRRVDRIIRSKEWRIIRIWQHDLRLRLVASVRRVKRALERGVFRITGAASVSSMSSKGKIAAPVRPSHQRQMGGRNVSMRLEHLVS